MDSETKNQARRRNINDDGSRYLEQNVGQVKHAYAEAVHPIAEPEVRAHPEIGKRNVDAIDVIHDVNEEHKRKQSVRNSASGSNTELWMSENRLLT